MLTRMKRLTTLTNKLTTAINTAFNSAWKDFKSKAKKDSGSISGSFSGKLDASTNAAVNVKDWTVDIGKLAALVAIENPPLALVLSKALGKATLGGAFSASLAGSVGLNVAGKKEWSDEEIQTTLSQWDSKFSSSINTEVTSSITTQVKNSASSLNIKVDSKQEEEKHGKEKKVASSSETLGVKFVVYDASISVTKG